MRIIPGEADRFRIVDDSGTRYSPFAGDEFFLFEADCTPETWEESTLLSKSVADAVLPILVALEAEYQRGEQLAKDIGAALHTFHKAET
jgi:hypothetical protein